MQKIEIIPHYGHYEIYIDGIFYSAEDSKREAEEEVMYLKNKNN